MGMAEVDVLIVALTAESVHVGITLKKSFGTGWTLLLNHDMSGMKIFASVQLGSVQIVC